MGRAYTNEFEIVIAGLVPATHKHANRQCQWVAGTRPAKTVWF